jgi:4-alpha-glucanotransferase
MKITFSINYRTNWGESLYICGDIPQLGNGNDSKAIQLGLTGAGVWEVTVDVPATVKEFKYFYIVKAENREWRFEWGEHKHFVAGQGVESYKIEDHWQEMPGDKPFYSSAFVDAMLARQKKDADIKIKPNSVVFKVEAPMISPDEVLAVSGEGEALGDWDVAKAVRFNDSDFPCWQVVLPADKLQFPFQYKFLVLKAKTGEVVCWENSSNRVCFQEPENSRSVFIDAGLKFNNPKAPWKGAGTAIPVFSIRSNDDFGVGDFMDLKGMVDWCALTGQKVLQLLPVNDTTMTGTWTDSYPYNGNSTFALHPMFIRLQEVGVLKDKKRQQYFDNLQRELNQLPEVDYERVNNAKAEYMHEIFAQKRASVIRLKAYKDFMKSNESWLLPYAAFCVLRDTFHTAEMSKWGEYAVYNENIPAELMKTRKEDMEYVFFVQYFLDKQLREVRDYAHSKGVILKGDIPIGISRTSVDAWINPRLFNLNCQAGAPPDAFSVLGQNWGFPTYNWEEMARDGFAWWKARFRKMSEYFDAYRIDHILGFFRIWQLPMNALHGLLGIFNPALPFTPDEMRNNYDFWLDVDLHTNPLIMEWMLGDFFGEYTQYVKDTFLDYMVDGRWRLKPEFDTQRKVADYFATQEKNDKNTRICNGLLGIIDDVLFIEDPYQRGKYHPRISAQFSYQYRRLNDYEKWCFDRLYNDFFYRRNNDFWWGKAMWKLPPLLDSTSMLTCAEDLGMIPDCVPSVMNILKILSLEIERMPKNPKEEFGNTHAYPYYSVCTTSTHDMPGIRAWWESDREMAQRYFNHVLHEGGEAPYFAEPWICEKIVNINLQSTSMLCILPLQDWLATNGSLRRDNPNDEQINIPANPKHYWRYRMHITVEQLLTEDAFNNSVKSYIYHSGR